MSESPNRDAASLSLEAALYDSGAGRFSVRTNKDDAAKAEPTPKTQANTEAEQTDR